MAAWKPWRLPYVVPWIERSLSEPGTTRTRACCTGNLPENTVHRSRSVLDPGSDLAGIDFQMAAIRLYLDSCAYQKLALEIVSPPADLLFWPEPCRPDCLAKCKPELSHSRDLFHAG